MSTSGTTRITRWVFRIAAGLAGAYVLLATVFTAPSVAASLRLDPAAVAAHPWTLLTYPLVHESFLHLLFVVILLFLTGPAVERHLGSRGFVLFWVYCTVGTAVPAIVLASLGSIPPLSGGLAPALGVAFARAWFGEDDEVSLEPLPFRIRLRVLTAGLVPLLVLPALVWRDHAISLAHLGGLPAAFLFLKLRGSGRRIHAPAALPMRRPVMAPIRLEVEAATTTAASSPPAPIGIRETRRATSDEVNRVLDKISALGMDSLTDDERRILREYSERKRQSDGLTTD
jgi:membrane associated rhomboid family serine protease